MEAAHSSGNWASVADKTVEMRKKGKTVKDMVYYKIKVQNKKKKVSTVERKENIF